MTQNEEWDYIVVGAGSAGCVLAARLSENKARRVLLIEAGGGDLRPAIQIPGLTFQAIANPQLNWRYEGAPDPTLGGRALNWAAGRALGGGSSINGMVFSRGVSAVYDGWAAKGAIGWDWASLLPYFRRSETWRGPPDPARGASGPLEVRRFEETVPACRAWLDAAVANGVSYVEDYNVGIASGVGLTQASQRGGWRRSTARAYLGPARRRPNLRVMTHTIVDRLILDKGRCIGVEIRENGRPRVIRAAREVAVSAGAIASPKLLMLSGIGPADSLRDHGVAVTHPLPGVGANLNEHVNVKISVRAKSRTYTTDRRGLAKLGAGARWLANRTGPASSPVGHIHGFLKTDSALAHADLQIQVMPFGFDWAFDDPDDAIGVVISLSEPQVRGRISLRSGNPDDRPDISIALLSVKSDVDRLRQGCALIREINHHPSAAGHLGDEIVPGAAVNSEAGWLDFMEKHAALNWHPTSTCRMGAGENDVVDAALRVHGVAGLSIADASIMPTVTSANTNAPIIAIAEKAAELIAARTA